MHLRALGFFNPGSGMEDTGSGINIPDLQNCWLLRLYLSLVQTAHISAPTLDCGASPYFSGQVGALGSVPGCGSEK
jgi:hypothetical protein